MENILKHMASEQVAPYGSVETRGGHKSSTSKSSPGCAAMWCRIGSRKRPIFGPSRRLGMGYKEPREISDRSGWICSSLLLKRLWPTPKQ